MKKVLLLIAKVINFLGYPLKALVLHNSRRTRVLILAPGEILLVKSYLGSQMWSLPGGGVNNNEDYATAASRELFEETGVKVKTADLKPIGGRQLPTGKRFPTYRVEFFTARVASSIQPKVTHNLEIVDAQWFRLDKLPKDISPTVQLGLSLKKRRD